MNKFYNLYLSFLLILFNCITAYSQESNSPQLLIFTGSDWCVNCMYLEKHVLQDSAFLAFTSHNSQLLIADFPQHRSLPAEEEARNNTLAERYNREGVFPKIVLLQGNDFRVIEYHRQGTIELLSEIKSALHQP
ncbi:MAG: thioredoxin family protein [Bacteroidetes bacterium]|nr:thioredoxin family protein [Bacteroidota bacterium]